MFNHECSECINLYHQVEEKDKKIILYENNLYELKSKIVESNNLINVYFNYKNENEHLKKELESHKKKQETSSISSQLSYDVKYKYLI